MLLKTCIIEENESYRKIVKLFGWITNKKAEIDATPYSTRVILISSIIKENISTLS